jgi:transketolase
LRSYDDAYPEKAKEWHLWIKGDLPEDWDKDIPSYDPDPKGMATRVASGKVLNAIAQQLPNLFGGSADLAPSNKTEIDSEKDFQPGFYEGRNLRFGVREHAMASVLNGMALHGGIIPYAGTFLVFSDYMRPAIRLAALMGLKVIYIFTHDSIGLGEDGPTHQPIEHLASLRAIPNLTLIRPCDANETAEAWRIAMAHFDGPVALALTRQGLPTLDRSSLTPAEQVSKGAYVLKEPRDGKPDIILIATGSEVHAALDASEKLHEKGIKARVVSMPSWELFDKQPEEYRNQVLPPEIMSRIAIEAGIKQGWHRYVGNRGEVIGLDHFGASAPSKVLFEKFGINADRIVQEALELLDKNPS